MKLQCLDRLGRTVSVGDKVRLIELAPRFLKSLPADEIEDVRSMIGKIFEVYEIDSYGCAWIGKGWNFPEGGEYIGHSLGLEPHEMELVDVNDSEQMSNEYLAVQRKYESAMDAFTSASIDHAGAWFRPDIDTFISLYSDVLPFAESGDAWAQYAIATILNLGLRCSTQQEYAESYQSFQPMMSHWWASAAKQGHLDALDNLVTSGVGVDAEKARAVAKAIQQEMPELIGTAQGMPSYGPEYFKELYKRFSGEELSK